MLRVRPLIRYRSTFPKPWNSKTSRCARSSRTRNPGRERYFFVVGGSACSLADVSAPWPLPSQFREQRPVDPTVWPVQSQSARVTPTSDATLTAGVGPISPESWSGRSVSVQDGIRHRASAWGRGLSGSAGAATMRAQPHGAPAGDLDHEALKPARISPRSQTRAGTVGARQIWPRIHTRTVLDISNSI
jgi:hypothetical protein